VDNAKWHKSQGMHDSTRLNVLEGVFCLRAIVLPE
jgi:hypothetical protein